MFKSGLFNVDTLDYLDKAQVIGFVYHAPVLEKEGCGVFD